MAALLQTDPDKIDDWKSEGNVIDWMRFFNGKKKEEFKRMAEANEYFAEAYDALLHLSADEQKRLEYEAREDAIRDHNAMMDDAEKRGMKQGLERGIEQGIEQGIKVLAESLQELEISREKACHQLLIKYNLTEEKANEYLDKYWKQR